MSAKKLASVGAQNYCDCEMRNALTTTCQSGTMVYRRSTGFGWPPLGATTGANEPHTQLGLVIIKKLRWTTMFLQSTVV